MPHEFALRLAESFPQVALTTREVEVLTPVAEGLAKKQIATRFGTAFVRV